MFKVMCISSNWIPSADAKGDPEPIVGDIDVVIEAEESPIYGGVWYRLERFDDNWYLSTMFAILPEPSADDMAEEEFEAIVNLETA